MELAKAPIQNELPSKPPRSKRRWLIGFALLVGIATIAYQFRHEENEGQGLAGRWTNSQKYSDESKVDREWNFEANGRVSGTNLYVVTGKAPRTSTQKIAGQWRVRNGSLHIKFDRSSFRDAVLAGSRAYTVVHNAITGQSLKVIDSESAEGELVMDAPDEFTVIWADPSSTTNVMPPQIWTRVQ